MSEPKPTNTNALVAAEERSLAVAEQRSAIAARALGDLARQPAIEFFSTHEEAREAFVEIVSGKYALSEALIERYVDRWDWWSYRYPHLTAV